MPLVPDAVSNYAQGLTESKKRILQADAYSIQKKFISTFSKMAVYGIPLNNCAMLPKAPQTS